MNQDRTFRNAASAAIVTGVSAWLLVWTSWQVFEFDPALFLYAEALVLSLTFVVYRLTIWGHRPPTAILYRRALAQLRSCPRKTSLLFFLGQRIVAYFVFNRFVWKRGWHRWSAHWPIMVGCLMALAIVVPLILGWVWFETPADDLHTYQVMLFGQHVRTLPIDGWEAFLAFHGLVWASLPVLIGCCMALSRRLRDRGDQATQTFEHDYLPLLLLLSVTITGLLLTLSYSAWEGFLHAPLAAIHCAVVCATLLWLPYSKLFHIPQRSLKLAHMIYQHESPAAGRQICDDCGETFADVQQIQDLMSVQQQLGYQYEMGESHYQAICPRCRRAALVVAQGARWRGAGV